jgi:uncharacterized protein (UPF0333 family)
MKNPKFQLVIIALVVIVVIIVYLIPSADEQTSLSPDTEGTQGQTTAPAKAASEAKPPPTAIPTAAPIVFSDEQASAFLLVANDFPKNWTAKKDGMILDAQFVEPFNAKMIKITLQTHETEAAAQTAFSAKKTEAQATIADRGISGDKLEDVKKYPLFVWNASSQANISGVEKWTVIGVYGNITVKVYHEGSMGAPKKGFAVDIAKKQMDKIMGD